MDRELRLAIGKRIRELRVKRQIGSQEKLADLAGMHRTYIGLLERGEVGTTVESIQTVSKALGVSLGEFFKPWR